MGNMKIKKLTTVKIQKYILFLYPVIRKNGIKTNGINVNFVASPSPQITANTIISFREGGSLLSSLLSLNQYSRSAQIKSNDTAIKKLSGLTIIEP